MRNKLTETLKTSKYKRNKTGLKRGFFSKDMTRKLIFEKSKNEDFLNTTVRGNNTIFF